MNAFEIYCIQNHQYLHIKQHTEKSEGLILELISKQDPKSHDLDLLHKILKHARACPKPCSARQLTAEIRTFVLSQLDTPSLPLIVCLIDLLKNNTLDSTDELIDWGCRLWQHPSIYVVRKAMELCKRAQDRAQEANLSLVAQIIQYITQCQASISPQDIERLQSAEYTEFFYTQPRNITCDRQSIQRLVQNILSVLFKLSDNTALAQLTEKVQTVYALDPDNFLTTLFDVCCASDDDTIDLMDKILLLFQERPQTQTFFESLEMNPHTLFSYFIYRCGSSHDILIDLLLECDFLSYFHRYIIYASQDIDLFTSSLVGVDIDDIQSILINMLRVLEGDGFPYNTKPLVKRLNHLKDQLSGIQ
ncbi:hypothetical protein G6F56_004091 [Rhizopus delemar]|nr:hypothetical protein G6F56_004091 [Rhizopus delemar]